MKYKKILYASALTLGLVTVGSSIQIGLAKYDEHTKVKSSYEVAKAAHNQQEDKYNTVLKLEEIDNSPKGYENISQSFTSFNLQLRASAIANGVKHSVISVDGVSTSKKAISIKKLFKPLDGTNNHIVAANMTVKGSYSSYESFKNYLLNISKSPASVRNIMVDRNNFKMSLRVYAAQ